MSAPGRFGGKVVFASTGQGGPWYLTTLTFGNGEHGTRVPGMAARTAGEVERCTLYRKPDGSARVRFGDDAWIGLYTDLGWLVLVDDAEQALPLVLSGTPLGTSWRARLPDGSVADVGYTAGGASPILTVNPGGTTLFAPQPVTPSLDDIVAAKGCPRADLRGVDLSGADLRGLDLTGADLTGAVLTDAQLDRAVLVGATLVRATLSAVTLTGADLTRADLTGANLDGTKWGTPKSAAGIVLTGCSARGAVLGGTAVLDCSSATLSGGDFTGADLSYWNLAGADLTGATLRNATLDHATLNGCRLRDIVATRASVRHATLRGCDAQGSDFAHADLSFSDLTRIRMGSRAYLFSVASDFAAALDSAHYAPPRLVQVFQANGAPIADTDPVTVDASGSRWTVVHGPTTYRLVRTATQIDVFADAIGLTPACLTGAICQNTTASRASLAGTDLRSVRWYGTGATLDHADLTGAALCGALLTQLDLTQAYLNGADLSTAVLAQARLRGCQVGAGADGRAFSLDRAFLAGADFGDTTLLAAALVDAAVALPDGVPLLALPLADAAHLNASDIHLLAAAFDAVGQPLGTSPAVSTETSWTLDNHASGDPTAPEAYLVSASQGTLWVFDPSAGGPALFQLPPAAKSWLAHDTAPAMLVAEFGRNGFTLAHDAPVVSSTWWQITPSNDAPTVAPVSYSTFRVRAAATSLRVYGGVVAHVRDWVNTLPTGIAFSRTTGLDTAMDPRCIGPAGLPRSELNSGRVDPVDFWTVSPK